ncbi:MAG: hypothetical protein MI748_17490 [Opitutales bacterium]|nr:hypothetical protein [Opitutales bacterium]
MITKERLLQLTLLLFLMTCVSFYSFVTRSEANRALEFEIKLSLPGDLTLYSDTGNDFNSTERVVKNLDNSTVGQWNTIRIEFEDFNHLQNLRIDPLPSTSIQTVQGSIRKIKFLTNARTFHSFSDRELNLDMSNVHPNHFLKTVERTHDELQFQILENSTDPYLLIPLSDLKLPKSSLGVLIPILSLAVLFALIILVLRK